MQDASAKIIDINSSHKAEVRRSFITTTVWGLHPRSHHKGATGRVRTGNRLYPVLCHCQLGQDIPIILSFRRIGAGSDTTMVLLILKLRTVDWLVPTDKKSAPIAEYESRPAVINKFMQIDLCK